MAGRIVAVLAFCLLAIVFTRGQQGIEFDSGTRGILEEFYIALDGPGWNQRTHWLNHTVGYCNWYGVTCSPNTTTVVEINLDNNGLNGQMKFSIGNLKELTRLSLAENDILGRLPPTISRMTGLKYLNFSNNLLDSVIPPEYGVLDQLEVLDLGQNFIQGEIPQTIGEYGGLIYLDLAENRLTGSIPGNIGNLSVVQFINISYNSLTGWIPTELGERLHRLEVLDLSHNKLNGMIPEHLQEVPHLKRLDLSHNEIKVIQEFDKFDELPYCNFEHNEFSCPLPEKAEEHCKAVCHRHSTPVPGAAVGAVFAVVVALAAAIAFVASFEKQRIREESGVTQEDEDDF